VNKKYIKYYLKLLTYTFFI
ncbi:hypothetical protein FPSE_11269, partial [Fusarium pseudograminearum CS3096]